ncbi:50S ribosomal protein L21 [Candidatus Saccharibacteria bacterium]|nr:50S ribosomal protein L21 [Candidatus Saccharibacteria bacterium]
MKQAVIETGGKQYIVSKDDILDVELLGDEKKVSFDVLLIIDGDDVQVGAPLVKGAKVSAEVLEVVRAPKVTAIRYKAKKRVHKTRGHRQSYTRIKITEIS